MDIGTIKAFVRERIELHETCREECEEYVEDYWNRLSDFIASDIPGAIAFMTADPECTGEIFSDWSEVFDDVARKSRSRGFVDALSAAAKRFAAECQQYNIAGSIESAKAELVD